MQFIAIGLLVLAVVLAIASWDWLLKNKMEPHGKLSYAALACGIAWACIVAFSLPRSHYIPSRAVTCASDMRQNAVALAMYTVDHDDFLPAREWWTATRGYRKNDASVCSQIESGVGYGLNGRIGKDLTDLEDAGRTLLLAESADHKPNAVVLHEADLERRHDQGAINMVFADLSWRGLAENDAGNKEAWRDSDLVDWAKVRTGVSHRPDTDMSRAFWGVQSQVLMVGGAIVLLGSIAGAFRAARARKRFWNHVLVAVVSLALVLLFMPI